ncbi:MAG: hypothetical protein JWO86_6431 [Myxococcaceae bacterium]|jgi:hypothetical protein|nr:hypothetical protein [Myxococcaceae bacterium]
MKNIRRKAFDIKSLRLSPEEGFVLSRLDAPLSAKELVALTGIEESRVVAIVETLATHGVVDLDREGAAPAPAPAAALAPVAEAAGPTEAEQEQSDQEVLAAASAAGAGVSTEGEEPADEVDDPAEEEKRVQGEREYQKIYEQIYHPMERDARIAAAEKATGADLLALCLDAEPQVIHAVMSNPKAGLPHARMVALHHRTQAGLELVGRRAEFVSDAQVQRRLLSNPQLPTTLLRRMINPKLLMEVYKIAINREIPERSRVMTRELLQKKFMLGSGDERAALLIKTEGRCLVLLVNCALDMRTTQVLTSKTSYTVLFIQNLARWSATPPALLVHLLKQPVVRMNMGLKKMLLKHPNVPSETKRSMS